MRKEDYGQIAMIKDKKGNVAILSYENGETFIKYRDTKMPVKQAFLKHPILLKNEEIKKQISKYTDVSKQIVKVLENQSFKEFRPFEKKYLEGFLKGLTPEVEQDIINEAAEQIFQQRLSNVENIEKRIQEEKAHREAQIARIKKEIANNDYNIFKLCDSYSRENSDEQETQTHFGHERWTHEFNIKDLGSMEVFGGDGIGYKECDLAFSTKNSNWRYLIDSVELKYAEKLIKMIAIINSDLDMPNEKENLREEIKKFFTTLDPQKQPPTQEEIDKDGPFFGGRVAELGSEIADRIEDLKNIDLEKRFGKDNVDKAILEAYLKNYTKEETTSYRSSSGFFRGMDPVTEKSPEKEVEALEKTEANKEAKAAIAGLITKVVSLSKENSK